MNKIDRISVRDIRRIDNIKIEIDSELNFDLILGSRFLI